MFRYKILKFLINRINKEYCNAFAGVLLVIFIVRLPTIILLLSTTHTVGHGVHSYQIENRSKNIKKQTAFILPELSGTDKCS